MAYIHINIADAKSSPPFLSKRDRCLESKNWLILNLLFNAYWAWLLLWRHYGCSVNMVVALMSVWYWCTPFGSALSEYFRCWFYCYFILDCRSDVPDSPCVCPSLAGGYFSQKTWHNLCHHQQWFLQDTFSYRLTHSTSEYEFTKYACMCSGVRILRWTTLNKECILLKSVLKY